MYQQMLGDTAFYRLLLRFDEELAAAERPKGCRVCGKRLEASDFPRKPRGFGLDLGERFADAPDLDRRFACLAPRALYRHIRGSAHLAPTCSHTGERRQPYRARSITGHASPAEDARRAMVAAAVTVPASGR
jgi:hypothetical protein